MSLIAFGFRSLQPGSYLLNDEIPGVDKDGCYRGKAGFLIPAIGLDEDGQPQLRGFQLAVNEEEQKGGGKYVWMAAANKGEEFYKIQRTG